MACELLKAVDCPCSVMPVPLELLDADHPHRSHRPHVVDYRSPGNKQHRCGRRRGDDYCGCDAEQRGDRRYVNCLASRTAATLSYDPGLTCTALQKSRHMWTKKLTMIGIVAGVLVLVALILFLLWRANKLPCCRRRRGKGDDTEGMDERDDRK